MQFWHSPCNKRINNLHSAAPRYITLPSNTVKRASENIRERPVFCREELFAFFNFAAVFIVGVSNVGGATIMNEQACVESCV